MKKRNNAIDIAKAIGIILMIIGHCGALPYMPYRHFIFTFHMPLFFIISGYFFRGGNVCECLKKDAKHLMIPYLLTSFAIIILSLVIALHSDNYNHVINYSIATFVGSGSRHSCTYLSDLPSIGAIWFFPALLACKTTYNYLSQKYQITKRLIIASITYLIATLIGRYIIFLPFSILSGLSAIIFYTIGDYLKQNNPRIKWYFVILGLFCWVISYKYSHIYLVQPQTDLYFIDIAGATTATILVLQASNLIERLSYNNGILPWIGRNSMYILCFHLIDINVGISSRMTGIISNVIFFPYLATLIGFMIFVPLFSTWVYSYVVRKQS